MSQPIAWVTGAGGLIGSHLVRTAVEFAPGWNVLGLARPQLDLADGNSVLAEFHRQRPQLVIHCAALSSSVLCQEKPALARELNVSVTQRLAELAADIPFVFFSTDLVFDGRTGNYDESAASNPLSVYGETKAEAEAIVLTNPWHLVIRAALNGGISPTGDRGFNEQLRRTWGAGKTPSLFTDEFRSPIPAAITARAVWELILQGRTGIYHVAGSERLSRCRIGELVAARWPGLNPRIERSSLKDYRGAPRPADVSLNCGKAQAVLSFQLPGLTEWLAANPTEEF